MKDEDVCEIKYVNKKAVKEVESQMLKNTTFFRITDDFKILSDPTRFKMLYALSRKELCVCDLAALLGMTHSAISHQLRLMRGRNLVKFRKEGKNVYYSIADEHVIILMKTGIEHTQETRK